MSLPGKESEGLKGAFKDMVERRQRDAIMKVLDKADNRMSHIESDHTRNMDNMDKHFTSKYGSDWKKKT